MKKTSKGPTTKKVAKAATQSLQWVYKKGTAILKGESKNLLSIDLKKRSRATAKIGKSTFEIRNKGYWNPKTVIEAKDKQIAILNRNIWDNIPKLHFMDETLFEFHIYHQPTLILIISLGDGTEICSFQLLSNKPKSIKFSTKEFYTKSEKHLLIISLGQFIFHGIVKEYHLTPKSNDTQINTENKGGKVLRKLVSQNDSIASKVI